MTCWWTILKHDPFSGIDQCNIRRNPIIDQQYTSSTPLCSPLKGFGEKFHHVFGIVISILYPWWPFRFVKHRPGELHHSKNE